MVRKVTKDFIEKLPEDYTPPPKGTWLQNDEGQQAIKNLPWSFDDNAQYDEWINELLKNCPQEWESSEGSAESIITEYLHELEKRVIALGGTLNKYDGPEVGFRGPEFDEPI